MLYSSKYNKNYLLERWLSDNFMWQYINFFYKIHTINLIIKKFVIDTKMCMWYIPDVALHCYNISYGDYYILSMKVLKLLV